MSGPVHEFARLPGGKQQADMPAARIRGSADRPDGEPLVGLVYNPRSHRNRGRDLVEADRPGVLNARPDGREELPSVMAQFAGAGIELLVINGGDGTVRDVLTAALPFYSENWPAIAVLPKGKTNALNVDLGAPKDWSLLGAIEAFKRGSQIIRRPISIEELGRETGKDDGVVLGFIIGAGGIATGVKAGQKAHKMGAFNSLAVGATGAWGVMQALFGNDKNIWRRGVEMDLRLGEERTSLFHSGHGDPKRRCALLSTTLDQLPMGVKPFGKQKGGVKLAVIDRPRRRLTAILPLIMTGYSPKWLAKSGYHQVSTAHYEMDIAEQFILDGEVFPAGSYLISQGPELSFVVP